MSCCQWIHAPAKYAFCELGLSVQVALPDEDVAVTVVELDYAVEKGEKGASKGRIKMLPTDGYCAGDSYSIYTATIPAAELAGGKTLSYHFCKGDEESDTYAVTLMAKPAFPPLTITEISAWGGGHCNYIEFQNLTDKPLDLYEYELVLQEDTPDHAINPMTDKGGMIENINWGCQLHGRNPLADAAGVNVIPPHGTAVFRFLSPSLLNLRSVKSTDKATFLKAMADHYPETCSDIAERDMLFFQATTAEKVTPDSRYSLKPGCFELYRKYRPYSLYVVNRGADEKKDPVLTLEVCRIRRKHDVRRTHAQDWYLDPLNPRFLQVQTGLAGLTPGFLDACQAPLDLNDPVVPAIIPLAPDARYTLSSGDMAIRFAAVGKGMGRAYVYAKEGEKYRAYPAALNHDGAYEAVIPYQKLAYCVGKLEYYIEMAGGLYTAAMGTAEKPLSVKLVDNAGPEFLSFYPANDQYLENDFTPHVVVRYHDISGVNGRTSVLCLDGRNVSEDAVFGADSVTYTPKTPLAYGTHVLEYTLRDMLGNLSYKKIEFVIHDGETMHLYKGQVHSHTAESDGLGTVDEGITYARDVGEVDYFAITDHTHYQSSDDYKRQIEIANKYNENGKFACLYGFEMTWNDRNGYWGHMNLLNTDWIDDEPFYTDMYSFYKRLADDPNSIGQFNHPDDLWGDFDEYNWVDQKTADKMCLSEIRTAHYDRCYALSLSKGWRTGPVSNEDNHNKRWTRASNSIGYVVAPYLTRENVIDAFRRRRTYTTMDRNMQIYYRVNGEWLGSALQNPDKLSVDIRISTDNVNGIGKLELITEDNIAVATVDAGALRNYTWKLEIDPDFDYYYLKITNGNIYSSTAPVYVEGRDLLNLGKVHCTYNEDKTDFFVVSTTVKNDGDKTMTDVMADFYLSPLEGFVLRNLTPYQSVQVGKLAPGEEKTVTCHMPNVPGRHRATVVASGHMGKQRYADTTYVLLTPCVITKILPLTSDFTAADGTTVENPFPYVELFNPTVNDINLKGYCIKLWDECGLDVDDARTLHLDGYTIKAGGTLIAWMRPEGSALTAADFNARYGTDFVEGENLLPTSVRIISPIPRARKIDFTVGDEIMTRVHYGYYCNYVRDVEEDVPCLFKSVPQMTPSETRISKEDATVSRPGDLMPEQIPHRVSGPAVYYQTADEAQKEAGQKILTKLVKEELYLPRA